MTLSDIREAITAIQRAALLGYMETRVVGETAEVREARINQLVAAGINAQLALEALANPEAY